MDAAAYLAEVTAASSLSAREAVAAAARSRENDDRKIFSQAADAQEVARVGDVDRSLVRVFDKDTGAARFTRGTQFAEEDNLTLLFEQKGGNRDTPLTVPSREAFENNFGHTLAHNALQFINWDNVVAAGGAVLGCVQPVPSDVEGVLETRRYYQEEALGGSDVDLFLYGLSEEDANAKLIEIYEAVCQACPFEVVCFRSAHAVTLVSQFPYRHIQVVLRVYSSIYEVLAGFDVDACTYAYDGRNVYTTCRGHYALLTGYNTIDLSRRSPSYEMRLAKYAQRGFAVHVPGYDRTRVDPNVFDKPWSLLHGLAKLLVLEQLRTPERKYEYMNRQQAKKVAGSRRLPSRRQLERMEKVSTGESSNYSTVFLPWGPEHDAKQTMRLMRRKDIALNGTYFAKDRTYRLHPCFYGTAQEVLTDMSPDDPPIPDDVDPASLEAYVRGPLTWLRDDPGRQQVGSFRPLTADDWEDGAYCQPATVALFRAVNCDDVDGVCANVQRDNVFLRDFLGRSPLHLAVMAGSLEVARVLLEEKLVDAALRLPDGRNALHLAAQYNQPAIAELVVAAVRAMEAADPTDDAAPRRVTLDSVVEQEDSSASKLRPLHYAIMLGHERMVDVLLRTAGAKANSTVGATVPDAGYLQVEFVVPLVLLPEPAADDDAATAQSILECLAEHGGCAQDTLLLEGFSTVFHVLAKMDKPRVLGMTIALVERRSPGLAKKMLTMINYHNEMAITVALRNNHLECAKVLHAATDGVLAPTEEICEAMRLRAANIDISKAEWRVRNNVSQLRAVKAVCFATPLTLVVDTLVHAIAIVHHLTQASDGSPYHTGMSQKLLFYRTPREEMSPDEARANVVASLAMVQWLLQIGTAVDAAGPLPGYLQCGLKLRSILPHFPLGMKTRQWSGSEKDERQGVLEWLGARRKNIDEMIADFSSDDRAAPAMAAFLAQLPAGYQATVGALVADVRGAGGDKARRLALTRVSLEQLEAIIRAGGDAAKAQPLQSALLEGLDAAVTGTPAAPPAAAATVGAEKIEKMVAHLRTQLFASQTLTTGDNTRAFGGSGAVALSDDAKALALRASEAVYSGDLAALDAVLAEKASVALMSFQDILDNTLFVTALLLPHGDIAAVLARLLARAQREHAPRVPLVFEEGTGVRRFDNMKLLEAEGTAGCDRCCSSDESGDDDDDDFDDEDMDDIDSDEEQKRQTAARMHELNEAVNVEASISRLTPADLLCKAGYVPAALVDAVLPAAWREECDALRKLAATPKMYKLTPLELAVVQGRADVVAMILKFLKRYPSKTTGRASPAALASGRALRLAVALDNLEVVQLLVRHAGGGVEWESLAAAFNVSSVFAAAKKGVGMSRYRGISSKLEKRGSKTYTATQDVVIPCEVMTVAELAAFYGATGVLAWVTTPGAAAAALDEFLCDEPEGPVQAALAKFVKNMCDARVSKRAARAQLPDIAGKSTAEALALLGFCSGDGLAAFNGRGESLMLHAIQGHATASVEYLLAQMPELKDTPCWRGLYMSHSLKVANSYYRKEYIKNSDGTPDADPALLHAPCIAAAREGAVDAFTVLLRHGADLACRDAITGASVVQTLLDLDEPWGGGFCSAIVDVRGLEALKGVLCMADAQGVTGMMALCGRAHRGDLRAVVEVCEGVLGGGGGGERCRRGGGILHAAARAQSERMLRVLREWVGTEGMREDAKGDAPLDIALQATGKKAPHTVQWFRALLKDGARLERKLVDFETVQSYVLQKLRAEMPERLPPRPLGDVPHNLQPVTRLRLGLLMPTGNQKVNSVKSETEEKNRSAFGGFCF